MLSDGTGQSSSSVGFKKVIASKKSKTAETMVETFPSSLVILAGKMKGRFRWQFGSPRKVAPARVHPISSSVDVWVAGALRKGKISKKPSLFVRSRLTLKLVVVSLSYIPFDSPRSALSEYHSRISDECKCVGKRLWAATSTLCAPPSLFSISI